MSYDRIVFPTVPESRVVKVYRAIERFHVHYPMAAWFCWLGVALVAMTVSVMVPA